jgi:NAD(P)-dependent dehydrogenase (short-subunit alcohol dehydrogenase family)
MEINNQKILDGRTALVTGGTSGIGFHTALGLARMGAEIYMTGRDMGRGHEAERQICAASGHGNAHFIQADASTVGGNQELAHLIMAETCQLHILVNNVGGMYNDRWETDDGYEATLAMNFVGPFALTEALLPLLQRSTPARIVNVTSAACAMWRGDPFSDIQSREAYTGFYAYSRAKYLNLLWTFALARRLEDTWITVNAVHPGIAWTANSKISRSRSFPENMRPFWPVVRLMQRTGSPEKAAQTSIFLASAPEAANITGQYFKGNRQPKDPGPTALDQTRQEGAWELAASLVCDAPTAIPVEPAPAIYDKNIVGNGLGPKMTKKIKVFELTNAMHRKDNLMPPHCDSLSGPVVKMTKKALETGDVKFILPYVPEESEEEVIAAFNKVLPLHNQPNGAREIADTFFFETVVRLHRAGEGAPYTGLKPAGLDEGPIIPIAERAIETGSVKELKETLLHVVANEVEKRFEQMQYLKEYADTSVEDAREYVESMLGLEVWSHKIYLTALAEPHKKVEVHQHRT